MLRFSFFGFMTTFRFRQSIWIQFKFNSPRCSFNHNLIHNSIQPSIFHLISVHDSIQIPKLNFKSIKNSIHLSGWTCPFWQISPLNPCPRFCRVSHIRRQLEIEPQSQCSQVWLIPTKRMQMCSKRREYIVKIELCITSSIAALLYGVEGGGLKLWLAWCLACTRSLFDVNLSLAKKQLSGFTRC